MKIKYLSAALMCTATIASHAGNDVVTKTDSTADINLQLTATATIPDNKISFCNAITYANGTNTNLTNFADTASSDTVQVHFGADITGMNQNNGHIINMTVSDGIAEAHLDDSDNALIVTKIALSEFEDDANSAIGHPMFEALFAGDYTSSRNPQHADSSAVDKHWFTVDSSHSGGAYTLGDIRFAGLYDIDMQDVTNSTVADVFDGESIEVYNDGLATQSTTAGSLAMVLESVAEDDCTASFASVSGNNPLKISYNSAGYAFIKGLIENTMDDDETVVVGDILIAKVNDDTLGMFSENMDINNAPTATLTTVLQFTFAEE